MTHHMTANIQSTKFLKQVKLQSGPKLHPQCNSI